MPDRKQEAWGGEVQMPRWLRRVLHKPESPGDSPEAAHEARKARPSATVAQNADRAAVGPLSDLYHEGKRKGR
ncbi:MAG: hypothetical protein M3M99_02965 [Actinomycetota bacterium]|nr:hypothetical protein [Actinomycetota bacterium]